MEEKKFGIDFEPVKLCGCRFQFPAKFSASTVTNGRVPKLCTGKSIGGGIDILALHNDRLSVIELKNEGTENVRYVMRQAIVYAVFLNKLFKECPIWKEILCRQNIKGIDAVICMPEPKNKEGIPENGTAITYCDGYENVKINLNYIYFDKTNDNIEITKSSYREQ